jgi:hypothetical protein
MFYQEDARSGAPGCRPVDRAIAATSRSGCARLDPLSILPTAPLRQASPSELGEPCAEG